MSLIKTNLAVYVFHLDVYNLVTVCYYLALFRSVPFGRLFVSCLYETASENVLVKQNHR